MSSAAKGPTKGTEYLIELGETLAQDSSTRYHSLQCFLFLLSNLRTDGFKPASLENSGRLAKTKEGAFEIELEVRLLISYP